MKMRTAGRMQRIGLAALSFILALLACGVAVASDVERQIPVVREPDGSALTLEISREGTRQTTTPFLTLNSPTVQRFEDRIARKAGRLAEEIPSEATIAGSLSGIGLTGTPRKDSGRPETGISSRSPVNEEITVRSVKRFLKGLRASRKEKQVPAVVVAPPEQRLGMAGTSQR